MKTTQMNTHTSTRSRASDWAANVAPWPEPVNAAQLLDDLAAVFRRFVVLPEHADCALALWTLHTYAFELRDTTAYIGIESPEKRCGKTTLLTVLYELANRPVISSNISSPAFFRVIEELRPTLLIDEADTFLQGNDELRGILNSGYTRKTAFVVRVTNQVDGSSPDSEPAADDGLSAVDHPSQQPSAKEAQKGGPRLVRFSSWCPKAMAAIGRLPDTLADRCIVIRMERKTSAEDCERLKHLQTDDLKQQCARFVADHLSAITTAIPAIPPALNDRAADIWEPLLVLADLAGGPWPDRARAAAIHLSNRAQAANPASSLLIDIWLTFNENHADRLFSRDIVRYLNSKGERSWTEINKGRPITELWLSQRLRPYQIRPRTFWLKGECRRGYILDELKPIFRRYIPKAELEAFLDETRSTFVKRAMTNRCRQNTLNIFHQKKTRPRFANNASKVTEQSATLWIT